MCCFSGPVSKVEGTSIFARMMASGRQLLVYELSLTADREVAMVLPLPVAPGSGEAAVRFLDLKAVPDLFERLEGLFAPPMMRSFAAMEMSLEPLRVHTVGDFVASFVPSLADFSRLDARFRMPAGTLDRVPGYADWGFAVFQLAAPGGSAKIHPMAFELVTRDPDRLFFPTLHVHDGVLHDGAEFAHSLYTQGATGADSWEAAGEVDRWARPSPSRVNEAELFAEAPAVEGSLWSKLITSRAAEQRAAEERAAAAALLKQLIGDPATLRRRRIVGWHRNQDTWVSLR